MIGIRVAREERSKGAITGSHVLKPGTLIYIDSNIAKVRWDADGIEEFDLHVFAEETRFGSFFLLDNAPAGVVHQEVECRYCRACPLPGVRWHCDNGYDLCSKCYMADAPSLNHGFSRMLTPSSCSYSVGKRAGCHKTEAIEIADTQFIPKAGVQYAELDQSRVLYYKDHIVRLREIVVPQSGSSDQRVIREGDEVFTLLSVEVLNDSLNGAPEQSKTHIDKVFARVGVVKEVTMSQELVVDYGDFKCKWPDFIFIKVPRFTVGDYVFVMDDEAIVKKLSDGHGAWRESMKLILGKECKVLHIDDDDDVEVISYGERFLVNPLCLSKKEQANTIGQGMSHNDTMAVMDDIDRQLLAVTQTKSETENDELVKAAFYLGQLRGVLENMTSLPVNHQLKGHTALHVAANFNNLEDVELLLICGADGSIKDPNGYTALHIAARRDETGAIAWKLLKHGALPAQNDNKDGVSPLHLAVAYQKVETLKVLLQHITNSADVNVQNRRRETPLHIAVKNGMDSRMLDVLLGHRGIDCSLSDHRGNNPLQLAALLGNERAVRNILKHVPELLTRSKENGFSPLHLAAYGNNVGVAEILVHEKNCDLNATTNERFTALHLAVCQGHLAMMSYLLKAGARTDLQDVDGDTALTMVLLQQVASTNSWKSYSEEKRSSPKLCRYCQLNPPQAFFKPCGHKIACSECAKKRTTVECEECKRGVRRSVYPDD